MQFSVNGVNGDRCSEGANHGTRRGRDSKLNKEMLSIVSKDEVCPDFDGGRLSSDGGVILLAMAERRLGLVGRLAGCFPDRLDQLLVTHSLVDMIRPRVSAIACGYEHADDLDFLRADPAFKLSCGCQPDSGRDLCSQPTLSRLENAPGLKEVVRLCLCPRRSRDGLL